MTTPKAPTPDDVHEAIERITQKAFAACGTTQDARPFRKDRDTIRTYIASLHDKVNYWQTRYELSKGKNTVIEAALISSQAYLLEYHDAEINHARRLSLKNVMAHNTKALNVGENI